MAFNDRLFPLSPLKDITQRPHIIAFDTEDNGTGVGTNFICACVYEGEEPHQQQVFWSRNLIRKHIFKQHQRSTIVVAHNLRYDLDNIDYPEKTAERLNARTRLIGAVYHYGDKKQVKFLDTGNFFVGASIDSLGAQLGYKKLGCKCDKPAMDEYGICTVCQMFSVKYLRNQSPYSLPLKAKENIEEYCMRDAEICHKTMQKIIDMTVTNNTRFKCFTAPSLACRIFRTNYMKSPWKKRHMILNDIERLSYYGGRTEVFDYRYFEHVYAEDIRSSYPKAMHDEIYPFPSNFKQVSMPFDQAIQYEGISLVRVRVPPMHIPPLPYRREDGKLVFPIGEWTAAYTHPELRMAMRHGAEIIRCEESIIYPDIFTPFTGFIAKFYQMKDTAKGIEREFYKLLCNSLSGKWAEKRISLLTLREDDPSLAAQICQCLLNTGYEPESIPGTNLCCGCNKPSLSYSDVESTDGYITLTGCREPDPNNAFPILIAYITAYGRIKLFEDRLAQGNNGKAIVYGDTDSSMSDHDFRFNRGPALGDWEQQVYEGFLAYAPKYYDFGYKTYEKDGKLRREKGVLKLKGIPRKHEIIYQCPMCFGEAAETPEEVWKTNGNFCCNCYMKLDDSHKRYKFDRPLKTSEAERRKMNPNTWIIIKKHVSKIDNKRIKNSDGTSSPITINGPDYASFVDLLSRIQKKPGI